MENFSFDLEPRPPFRLDLTVWTLRRRPDNLIDRWDGTTYRRVLISAGGDPFEIAVTQTGQPEAPRLQVSIQCEKPDETLQNQARAAVERLLGINLDLETFYRQTGHDQRFRPLAEQFRGFKPPRYHAPFEALVNAISCQQLTLTMGIRLLNSLAQAYGPALTTEAGVQRAFPRPQDLAGAEIEAMRQMKFSYQKARYITGLAQAILNGEFDLDEIETLEDAAAIERLRSLKGVGRWTAEYFLLRGLGRTRIFPADDVGARNNLERWLGLSEKLNYAGVNQTLGPWQAYGGLLYFHLLLNSLTQKALVVV